VRRKPDEFWNQADLQGREAIQNLIFPNGIDFDFRTTFGTMQISELHLLLQKIASKKAIKILLVATPVPKWNQIKTELLTIHELMDDYRYKTEVVIAQ